MNPWKHLNWREVEVLAQTVRTLLDDTRLSVDRVVVPQISKFPSGYVKSLYVIRLSGRKEDWAFWISLRKQCTWFALEKGRGPPAAPGAPLSAYAQLVSRRLQGRKLTGVETPKQERAAIFRFEDLSLVLRLIPTQPEGFLVENPDRLLASSRDGGETKGGRIFDWSILTHKGNPPVDPVVRENLAIEHFRTALDQEAWTSRILALDRAVREKRVSLGAKRDQSRDNAARARGEPDWQREADRLKAQMGGIKTIAEVSGLSVKLDPKLDLAANLEALYRNAKRKKRRILEADSRVEDALASLMRLDELKATDWPTLLAAEAVLTPHMTTPHPGTKAKKGVEVGKVFRSRDGAMIRLGRNSKENLEVTFRAAKGNDLWLHVRGKPSAHAVIHLSPGKSAALETLLDAAALVLHFSKGADWGKTEVDYTFRKNVKRIKDSTQVSYTGNKTLIVAPDPERLARLLASESL